MKLQSIFLSLLLTFFIIGCGSSSDDLENKQVVVLEAKGLTQSVGLKEVYNGSSFLFTQDGTYQLIIPKGIFRFEITNSFGQSCSLSPALELNCHDLACSTLYSPVCAKEPLVINCVTTPCTTDRYKTYPNACETQVDNAIIAFDGECLGLENVASLHNKPVFVVPLASTDYITDSFTLLSSHIDGHTLTLTTEVAGGCGTHDVSVYVDNIITNPNSSPPTVEIGISHLDYDDCETVIAVTTEFDLLPLKENFRRLNEDYVGTVQLQLGDLQVYEFQL